MLDKIGAFVCECIESLSVGGIDGLIVFYVVLALGIVCGWGLRSGIVIEKTERNNRSNPGLRH